MIKQVRINTIHVSCTVYSDKTVLNLHRIHEIRNDKGKLKAGQHRVPCFHNGKEFDNPEAAFTFCVDKGYCYPVNIDRFHPKSRRKKFSLEDRRFFSKMRRIGFKLLFKDGEFDGVSKKPKVDKSDTLTKWMPNGARLVYKVDVSHFNDRGNGMSLLVPGIEVKDAKGRILYYGYGGWPGLRDDDLD